MKEIHIGPNEAGQRFDRFLLKYFNNSTRSNVYKLIRKKVFKVNDGRVKEEYFLEEGDVIKVFLSDESYDQLIKEEKPIAAEDVNLDIVYEDDEILIVNKPKGLLTHPDANEYKKTLTTQVHMYLNHLITKTFKPSCVQRLDKNTSGLVLFAKTYDGLKKYNEMMRERQMEKYYQCVVHGKVSKPGVIKGYLVKDSSSNKVKVSPKDITGDGKFCHTEYKPLKVIGGGRYTVLEVQLFTGRSHQIRAFLGSIGHPIVGDTKYGGEKAKNVSTQLLHGYKLVINSQTYTAGSKEIDAFIKAQERENQRR